MKTYEELLAERDALAAQVEALLVAIKPFATGGVCSAIGREDYSIMHERIKDWHGVTEFKKAQSAYNAAPQQCLAEIKANAIECAAEFELRTESYLNENFDDYVKVDVCYVDDLKQYAAKIRNGEIK